MRAKTARMRQFCGERPAVMTLDSGTAHRPEQRSLITAAEERHGRPAIALRAPPGAAPQRPLLQAAASDRSLHRGFHLTQGNADH